jgi:glycosyltransferase involved in cell wall biosynthesis
VALRVLQVVTDRDRRGAQVFALDLAGGLRDLGAEVETVALAPGTHGDLLPIACLGKSRRSVKTMRALRRRARTFDVVIAHGSSTLVACAVGLVFRGTPFVYRQISDPLHWAATWQRRLRVAAFLRRAAGVVVLAPSAAAVFANHYRVSKSQLTVIPNSVPAESFAAATLQQRLDARRQYGIEPDLTVVACIGALAVEKGVDIAIEAVALRSDCQLLVVGDGPDRGRLAELVHRLNTDSRVRFVGAVDSALPALHAADIVVLPSRGGDSMPAVLIEAGLCSLPTITTPVGAITDVVRDGLTGLVVPIGDCAAFVDALAILIADPERRASLGEAAAVHCRARFTIEVTAPAWLAALEAATR